MKSYLNSYITFRFKPQLAVWIFLSFIAFTVVGTLTHEMGHIAVARALGYKTVLHYGSMNYIDGPDKAEFNEIWNTYENEIKTGQSYLKKERRQELLLEMQYRSQLISAGGPLQTIVTGTIGLLLLYRRRRQISDIGMQLQDWLYVFLSLFWLRELFNPVFSSVNDVLHGEFSPFSGRSDEINLARSLGWWEGSISLPLAFISLLISLYVIFKIIPQVYRLTFIVAGAAGGIFGFLFWLQWVGPILLP